MSLKESFMREFDVELRPNQEFIELQSALKIGSLIDTGGQAKQFLIVNKVLVNGEFENRRGRKLYPGDVVEVLELKTKLKIVKP